MNTTQILDEQNNKHAYVMYNTTRANTDQNPEIVNSNANFIVDN